MTLYKVIPRKVFNLQPAARGVDPFQAAAVEAARARRPSDHRLQPNLIRSNSVDLLNATPDRVNIVSKSTRASLAKLSKQAPPGSLEESEVLASAALKITSDAKARFDALRDAAYHVFTLKGQIESNRYQLDRKRQDIQLLIDQLEQRGRQRSRGKAPPIEQHQRKYSELEGHVVILQRKEEELLQTHQLAVKWLRLWIRYSTPLQTAEEVKW